jgi:transcriptional regulator with XRE-family HTH domain
MGLDVGAHLKAVRQMYGLSQRELAKRAGVTNGLISLIEQNRVSPSVSSLKKVLDGIPMALAEFFTLDLAGQVAWPSAACPSCTSAMRPARTRARRC